MSSTSMFVSCKDYDDDINNIVLTKADKTELEAVRQGLQDQIDGMKTQLSTIEGQIATLTSDKANKFTDADGKTYDLVDVWTKLNPLLQKVSVLEGQMSDAQDAITALDQLIGGKLTGDLAGKTYKQAVEETWAKVVAINSDLGTTMGRVTDLENALNTPETGLKAVVADLKQQVNVLNGYKARVEAIEADYLKAADKTELLNKITTLETTLTTKIENLNTTLTQAIADAEGRAAADATTKAGNAKNEAIAEAKNLVNAALTKANVRVDSLKTWVGQISNRVDNNFALINALNVYINQALRALVFDMDSYYQGVPATDLTVLWFVKYTVPATGADAMEAKGYKSATDWTDAANGYVVTANDAAATWASVKAKYEEHKQPVANTDETKRYIYTGEFSRVLSFKAEYFMNPSSAKVGTDNGDVLIKAFDKPFHNSTKLDANNSVVKDGEFNGKTTTYEAGIGISAKKWKTENGKLIVNLDCSDPSKLRQITSDNAITVFATQVKVGKGDKDTTITSDFAALYKQDIKDIRLSHAKVASLTNVRNTHCGYCDLIDKAGLHLMQTVSEAAGMGNSQYKVKAEGGGFGPQDNIGYQDTIDLLNLVEVHYTAYDANGENPVHKMMSDAHFTDCGLHYEFELTGLWYGDKNKTSESAHAAIKHVAATETTPEKWLFRPQMPKADGTAAAWDNNGEVDATNASVGKQDRQTIGRTPIVRVKLLDDANNVLDYGYIRFNVTEDAITPAAPVYPVINYYRGQLTASENYCADLDYSGDKFEQSWIQMEYDIHNLLGFTQEEFENNYDADVQGDEFKQFYAVGEAVKAAADPYEKLGTIKYRTEDNGSQNFETSVITWEITGAQLQQYIDDLIASTNATKATETPQYAKLTRYIRFKKVADNFNGNVKNRPEYIYIAFIPSGLTVNPQGAVSGAINWTGKNPNYWYLTNSSEPKQGLVEAHANVYGVEDEIEEQTSILRSNLPALFIGNELVDLTDNAAKNAFITLTGTTAVTGKDLTLRLAFVKNGVNSYKGIHTDGVEYNYYMKIKGDSTTLYAWRDADKDGEQDAGEVDQEIAQLVLVDANKVATNDANTKYDINHAQVDFKKTENAKALLNYSAHYALNDNLLTAFVTVGASYKNCEVPLDDKALNIRFLRPINVKNVDGEVQDASVDNKQVLYLRDLVQLSDWRDTQTTTNWKTNYWYYYGITDIQVVGIAAGDKLSEANVKTNLSAAGTQEAATKNLKEVSELLDFTYEPKTYAPQKNVAPAAGDFGTLTYLNLGSTVQDFKLIIPMKVKYIWGEVYTNVEVQVHHTTNNARLAK